MNTMWWRLLVAGVAVLIILCLGLLEIVADRVYISHDSAISVKNTEEPDRPWERN
jgi:hypothetical protein